MKFIPLLCLLLMPLFATQTQTELKKMIGSMVMMGFDGTSVEHNSSIIQAINKEHLGGVILFNKVYNHPTQTKNISSAKQLQRLTHQLQTLTDHFVLIGVDQEGGRVARLEHSHGFFSAPSATTVAHLGIEKAQQLYNEQAKELSHEGINLNFAPVLDLCANPKNKVIVGLERCYSNNVQEVSRFAGVMIDEQKKYHIISVAKHFPGHGSSLGDSHKGFVDVSETWNEKELLPYKELIAQHKLDMIMTAHVFNRHLDAHYPATLSYAVNTKLLRKQMGFEGVIVSDDMQMKAIAQHYSLKEAVTLAINSGVDILLFGNQLAKITPHKVCETIYEQVKNGAISQQRIEESYRRITNLITKYAIIYKPIDFGATRVALTKQYIKKHYGLNVSNITIKPKMVVVHWTAIESFKNSFRTFYPQKLLATRKDIVHASSLNVSAHFLVDRDGTIYQLMPDNWMARHVIGLNYCAIGIENVGGKNNAKEDLTKAQLEANINLIHYLKAKYPSITEVIGHYEYRRYENTPLWLEKDSHYRTQKADPGKKFMGALRDAL